MEFPRIEPRLQGGLVQFEITPTFSKAIISALAPQREHQARVTPATQDQQRIAFDRDLRLLCHWSLLSEATHMLKPAQIARNRLEKSLQTV